MITKADIKQETNSVSYNRGKKIYEEQKVHAFQVQEMEDIFGYQLHKITAVVDGSGKNMYCVSVSVDEEMSEIMEDIHKECGEIHMEERDYSTGDCANIVSLFCCTILNGGKKREKNWKKK